MIDLNSAIKFFHEYAKNYPNTPRVQLKIDHILRVMQININLAKQLGLSDEDIKLAGLIGLLHDIGRFEQVRVYNTFIDKDSINHAMYSSEQLFEKGLIRKFITDDQYDLIIRKAIENHNRFEIEDGLDERTILHCKMIRDSDKCDIYEQVLQSDGKLVFDGPYDYNVNFSPKVMNDFFSNKGIKTEDMHTVLDDFARKEAFVFGLYFKQSLLYIHAKDFLSKLRKKFLDTFDFNDDAVNNVKLIEKYGNDYVSSVIKEMNDSKSKKK